jgi:ribosomal protein S18 acetylase RimI-like enzyme
MGSARLVFHARTLAQTRGVIDAAAFTRSHQQRRGERARRGSRILLLMTSEVVVRRAEPEDLESAAELAGRLARQHHEADAERFFLPDRVEQGYSWWFSRELRRREAVIVVALEGGGVVGYAYGALEERNWNLLLDAHGAIHDIYVLDRARRLGVGRKLLDAIIAELEALGAPRIVLATMVSNQSAQRLFQSRGFRPTMLEMMRSRR